MNLLHHTKLITSLKVSRLCNQHNYRCIIIVLLQAVHTNTIQLSRYIHACTNETTPANLQDLIPTLASIFITSTKQPQHIFNCVTLINYSSKFIDSCFDYIQVPEFVQLRLLRFDLCHQVPKWQCSMRRI